jgi:hypothetical protein
MSPLTTRAGVGLQSFTVDPITVNVKRVVPTGGTCECAANTTRRRRPLSLPVTVSLSVLATYPDSVVVNFPNRTSLY